MCKLCTVTMSTALYYNDSSEGSQKDSHCSKQGDRQVNQLINKGKDLCVVLLWRHQKSITNEVP